MTEDDTFNALKKWTLVQLEIEIYKPADVDYEREMTRINTIFTEAGWTRQEYNEACHIMSCISFAKKHNIGNH